MKTKINYLSVLSMCMVLFCLTVKAQQIDDGPYHDYDTFRLQKKMIVGTFLEDGKDKNLELEFTKEGKCYMRYLITGDATEEYTYTLKFSTKKADVPAGYRDVYTLYLKAIPADPNEDLTYEMYVDDTGLALYPWPMGIGGQFVFSRVKTKEPAAAAPKKEEVKPEEKKKMAAEAHFVGTYDCLERNEYGHSLKDPTYEKDYSIGWEQAGCMAP